jgi:ABC-type nitrate/sulfonate/bicarbonate transport system substrate-binding protein
MKKIISLLLITLVFSCKNDKSKTTSIDTINIVQEWFANANYAGEVVAQHRFDSINNIDLKIIEGSYEIDPIKMVLANEAQIGVAGADKVLVANDKGADLVVFGVVNPISPVCFVSLKEKNINSVNDFKGNNIGVLTGTATEYVYRSLLEKEGIKSSELNETEISFDLNTFINKMYDVRPAFIFDEPVSLDNQNIAYNILEPSNYGINFLGTVYFCKREYLEKNKELIQRLTNTLISGWDYALVNNEDAINYLKKSFPSIDEKRELASLKKGITYFKGDNSKQLYAVMNKWEEMAISLKKLNVIKEFKPKYIDYSFINKYYNVEGN